MTNTKLDFSKSPNEIGVDENWIKVDQELRRKFKTKVGYSDHTPGIEASIAAVAIGATVIEKHLTLNKNLSGPDHKASIEPNEFKRLVNSVRNIEAALGSNKNFKENEVIKN